MITVNDISLCYRMTYDRVKSMKEFLVQMVQGTGKFQYRDTRFVARVKAFSGLDCYNRIVDHLRQRVDERSQFPSAKGKNFRFRYLGKAKKVENKG